MTIVDQIQAVGIYRSAAIAAAVLVALNWIRKVATDPLKNVPGPTLARYSRLWLLREYFRGDYHNTDIELHRKHGPIVRIGPNQYSIDDPAAAKIIYGHSSKFYKSDWYLAWGVPSEPNLFKESNPAVHASLRRPVAMMYSLSSLVSYEPYVDECLSLFCDRLSEISQRGSSVDMRHWFTCYAFDVIGLITLSKRFGTLDAGEDIGSFMVSGGVQHMMASCVGVFSSWYPLIFKVLTTMAAAKTAKEGEFANMFAFVVAAIEERRHNEPQTDGKGPQDFVGKLLAKRNADGKEGDDALNDAVLISAAGGNIGAGSDTTAVSLTAVFYYLCRHPEATKKLRAEIDALGPRRSSPLTFQEAQSMPYLQAVVKEALRLHPATGFTMPRVVPQGGSVLAGQFFPAGTVVGINSWVAHRNRSVFGQDADEFRPERWLEDPARSARMDSYSFTFGQGSRTCIGKNISLLEMNKCIPHILQRFDFELEHPDKVPESTNHWFVKQKEVQMRIKERR